MRRRHRCVSCLVGVVLLALLALVAPRAARAADEEPQAFAKVVVDEAELRTGPGISFRVIYTAHRGETLALDGRPGTGYWLRVVLPDGRIAFALGDDVEPFAVVPGEPGAPSRPGIFAPPPLEGARAGLAILGGVVSTPVANGSIQQFGYVEARPSLVLHRSVTLDGFIGDLFDKPNMRVLESGEQARHEARFVFRPE